MRVSGEGDVFFASEAGFVFLIDLTGDALSVNARNLLAFDSSIEWDIKRVQGAGMLSGGLFNTTLQGTGTVAIHTVGQPVILDCSQQPTYVDVQACVGWSANLVPQVVSSMNVRSMLRGGSGEAFQYAFSGPGFVIVQPERVDAPAAGGRVAAVAASTSAGCSTDERPAPRRPTPSSSPACAPTWRAAAYTVEAVGELLGPLATAALGREQVLPAQRVTADVGTPLATLVRLFGLGDAVDTEEAAAALPTLGLDGAQRARPGARAGARAWSRPATCGPTARRATPGGSPPTSPSSRPARLCARTTSSASAGPRRRWPRGRHDPLWSGPSTSAPGAACRPCTSASHARHGHRHRHLHPGAGVRAVQRRCSTAATGTSSRARCWIPLRDNGSGSS